MWFTRSLFISNWKLRFLLIRLSYEVLLIILILFSLNSLNKNTQFFPCIKTTFRLISFNLLWQLNHLISENRQREIVDSQCEGIQAESLDALLSIAIQCVSSAPEDRPTMHRVVQILESEVTTPCPSDFYDSSSEWKASNEGRTNLFGTEWFYCLIQPKWASKHMQKHRINLPGAQLFVLLHRLMRENATSIW